MEVIYEHTVGSFGTRIAFRIAELILLKEVLYFSNEDTFSV
jgi:hypothetical protein